MSEAFQPAARPADAVPAWFNARWLKLALAVLEPLSVAGLFVFMLTRSWLRWGEPLIDFPRDLYLAWRVSEGDLLYQQITHWYGPLANLVEGAGFRVFGAGLDTMVWMNIVLAAVVLLLLRSIFGAIGNRLMVWLGSVAFVAIFMAGHYTLNANYNFITPYNAQATYSFLGLLLVLWGLLKHLKSNRPIWLGVAGLGFAVAYLDKPEAVLAALGACIVYFSTQTVYVARKDGPGADWRSGGQWLRKSLGWFSGGFMGLWLVVFGYFFAHGGFAYAMRATNFVVVSLQDESIRQTIATAPLFRKLIGIDQPMKNFLLQLELGGGLVFISVIMMVAGWAWTRTGSFSRMWWIWLLAMTGMTGAVLWLMATMDADPSRAFIFPVCLAAVGYIAVSLWKAWRGRAEFSPMLGLAVVGVAGSLMLARILLNAWVGHYGFFLMPLAFLFYFQLMVVEAPRAVEGQSRTCWPVSAAFSVVLLFMVVCLGKSNLEIYARKTYLVGEGRDHFYTAPSEAYAASPAGWMVNYMVECFHKLTPNAKTLAVFPVGIAVNYHLRVPTPLTGMEFRSVTRGYMGPQRELEELKAHPPDAVFLLAANFMDDGVSYFGASENAGRDIVLWLNEHYSLVLRMGKSDQTITGDAIDLLVPKIAGDKRPSFLSAAK